MSTINKAVQKDRLLGGFVIIVVVVLSLVFVVLPGLANPGKVTVQTEQANAQLQTLRTEQTQLEAQQIAAVQQQATAEDLARRFPPTADTGALTALIQNIGAASGVTVTAVDVATPVEFNPTPAGSSGASPAATPAPAASGDAAPAPTTTEAATPPDQKIYRIDIKIVVTGGFTQTGTFVGNLENGARAIYTNDIVTGLPSVPGGGPTTTLSNQAGLPADSAAFSQQLTCVTFLLPPLSVQPPPPVQ